MIPVPIHRTVAITTLCWDLATLALIFTINSLIMLGHSTRMIPVVALGLGLVVVANRARVLYVHRHTPVHDDNSRYQTLRAGAVTPLRCLLIHLAAAAVAAPTFAAKWGWTTAAVGVVGSAFLLRWSNRAAHRPYLHPDTTAARP